MRNNFFKCVLPFFVFFVCIGITAQVTNEGKPYSWDLVNKKNTSVVQMPGFDRAAVDAEDVQNDIDKIGPYRFGYEFATNLGITNAGVWDNLPNGDRIWRINIASSGANTMNFIFDKYWLPKGAKLYIYSNDRKSLIGAYTDIMNHPEKKLGSWLVDGDNVWIEYFEPANVEGQGLLNIGTVVHGYRSASESSLQNRGLNDSGNCNLDVDCSIGADFDDKKDLLKHAVAVVLGGGGACSGTLLNNTSLDQEPYFIFANHCTFTPATTAFRFNWISPDPVCAATTNSTTSATNTTSGAELLATSSQSDYRFFRITGGINANWDIEWAGWDASDDEPDYTIGIHHPAIDIMKVCRNDTGLSKTTSGGQIFWTITTAGGGWEMGVTEGGSSGSGLFNQDGQLIGTLCCGLAACSGTSDNNQWDSYGRFAISYNNGGLAQWLDPTDSGVTSLRTYTEESILSVADVSLEDNFSIFPNPTSTGIINLRFDGSINTSFEYIVYGVDGKKITAGSFETTAELKMESQSNGIYFIKIKENTTGNEITKKVIIAK